jgi:hypothetical protein
MKKISFSLAVMLVLLGSLAIQAIAQNRVIGRTNIPFSFTANGQQLSAGNYELWQIGMDSVRLQNVATAKGVTLHIPQDIVDSNAMKFVFHSYGSSAFLASVAAPSDEVSLPKSQSEKELAAAGPDMKTVALQVKH